MGVTFSVFDASHEAPDDVAVAGAVSWTFGELARDVEGWISAWGRLIDAGPVALVPRIDPPSLLALYALLTLRVPTVLVHPRYTTQEQKDVLGASGASWLCEHGRLEALESRGSKPLPDGALVIVPTSGTTGRPKLAVLSEAALAASAASSEANLGWRTDDRWLLNMPLSHVGGLSVVTRTLLARRTVVLPPSGVREDGLLRVAVEHDVTLMSMVPTTLQRLLAAGHLAPPRVRAVLLGGAPAGPGLVARARALGWPILTTYGMTEACSQVATCRLGQDVVGVGPPLRGFEVRVVDGQIQLRGGALMDGYLGEASPFVEGGWLPTGDLGFLDATGNLHVRGRRDELIISGGENVYPAEVEDALRDCPGVESVCVFGVDDDEWGQRVAVAVAGDVAMEQLARYGGERLAGHRRPRLGCRLPGLVLLDSGKIDRKATIAAAVPLLRPLG